MGTVFQGSYYSQAAQNTFSYTITYDTSIRQTGLAMVGYFNATLSNSTYKVRLYSVRVDVFFIDMRA